MLTNMLRYVVYHASCMRSTICCFVVNTSMLSAQGASYMRTSTRGTSF